MYFLWPGYFFCSCVNMLKTMIRPIKGLLDIQHLTLSSMPIIVMSQDGLVMSYCIHEMGHYWIRLRLGACLAPNHYQNHCQLANWSLRKTRQIWGIWKLRPAYSPETHNLGQNRWCFVPCDLEIWWMTLENNRASLLCCFKLCATFHSHWWIQTGVTVRKRPIWVKFDDF